MLLDPRRLRDREAELIGVDRADADRNDIAASRLYGRRTSRRNGPRRSQFSALAASSPGVGGLALTNGSRG
jgi:hypothetical protein